MAFLLACPAIFLILSYVRYARLIDAELHKGAFSGTSDMYAAVPQQLIANVSNGNREHRLIVGFEEIPQVLVNAVISVEDKRFFQHNGLDPLRMIKAAYIDLREGRKDQGASTLTMQLARSLWLAPKKNWKRKVAQFVMALRLEAKLTKQQIFTYYCNQVYLGRSGTFSLHGFGAAASAYFGKDIADLTLPEAATLAGLIHRPSYYHGEHGSDRILRRRNLVLSMMRRNGYLGDKEYLQAVREPVAIAPAPDRASGEAYFMDLASDELRDLSGRRDEPPEALEVHTTLDLNLQQAANEAVRIGMRNVDELLRIRAGKNVKPGAPAQVALVALDPHTGEVRALVGGRNYTASQLNRALAERQPGSVFKPFVYSAALNTALVGGSRILITPATMITDAPTTFWFGNTAYQPSNFGQTSSGEVTVRQALRKSLNIPAVRIAQMAGYDAVATLARQAGLGEHIQPTPSIALGSYEVTPLDIAGAYTIFANQGAYVRPRLISRVAARGGAVSYSHQPETRQVLDPRVAFLIVNLMEDVMNSGTAAGVRSRGFIAPAAGKTGTSRDGWFAGFTSQLLCVVWVGFDDNSELNLEGSKSALPIWTEFMKRAIMQPLYKDAKPFKAPRGIVNATIDPETGLLASPDCLDTRTEFFIAGTEPAEVCPHAANRLAADRQ